MMEQEWGIFDDGYIEPKAEEKAALIAKLISGDFTLSFSSLEAFSLSPRAFIAYKLRERVTTPAIILGEAVHCLILEPDQYEKRFMVAPDVNASTKEGKTAWAKIYEDSLGEMPDGFKATKGEIIAAVKAATNVTVIDHKVAENAKMRARAILNNRASRWVLNQIEQTEIGFGPKDKTGLEIDGIRFTGKIDGYGKTYGIICDAKNMPNAAWEKATGAIWGRKLHWQAHIYDRAMGYGNACYILAVDPTGEVSVHGFAENHLMRAGRQISKMLERFKECIFLSQTSPEIWDSSQEFWLTSDFNEYGINYI